MRLGTAVLLLSAGCAPAAYRVLPAAERDAFEACAVPVEGRNCLPAPELERNSCVAQLAPLYASLPDREARRAFLVQLGCPEVLVQDRLSR
jgi:hypothetical protein